MPSHHENQLVMCNLSIIFSILDADYNLVRLFEHRELLTAKSNLRWRTQKQRMLIFVIATRYKKISMTIAFEILVVIVLEVTMHIITS